MKNTALGHTVCVLLLLSLMSASGPVIAAEKGGRERESLRRAQQMLSRLQQKQAETEQQNGELTSRLSKASAENEALKRQIAEFERKVDRVKQEASASEQQRKAIAAKLSDAANASTSLEDEKKAMEITLQANEARLQGEKKTLLDQMADTQQQHAQCLDKNNKLSKLAVTAINRYEQKGFWDVLARKEPFVGYRAVEVETLLQEYSDTLAESRVETSAK